MNEFIAPRALGVADMAPAPRRDLDAILDTIREVEDTLEKRSERATGAIMMVWGAMAGLIFGFYHLVSADTAVASALGGLVAWAWVPPMLVGYALTAVVGARLGRVRARGGQATMRRLLLALLLPLAGLVLLTTTGRGVELVPAMWTAFLGYTMLLPPSSGVAKRRPVFVAAGVASFALAAILLVPALHPWGNLVAGIWYVATLGGLGALKYSWGA